MELELHTDPDHHVYGVRGRVVQAPDCGSGNASSILVARPEAESFTVPFGDITEGLRVDFYASVAEME